MRKICSELDCHLAGEEQDISNFILSKKGRRYSDYCSKCAIKRREKSKLLGKAKKAINDNKYYVANKAHLNEKSRIWYINNKDRFFKNVKEYRINNKAKIAENLSRRKKERMKEDPAYKLREGISTAVRIAINATGSSKNNKSILKYLPFTINELKSHLESLFEPWMNWENRGMYDPKTWIDDDNSTWTWQIDHIIPHSTFEYFSMEDASFKECWDLSNLRPYSAKQNLLDGANRVRHNK